MRSFLVIALILSAFGNAAAGIADWIVISQHRGSNGELWWRAETGPVTEVECRRLLKQVTGRPAVGATKWYDVTTQQLHDRFGTVATPTKGSWVACWSENVWRNQNVIWAEPDT